jgi:hypothetical protein
LRTQIARIADSGDYPRPLTAVLHDKVPKLASVAATKITLEQGADSRAKLLAEQIMPGLRAHADWLAAYQRENSARLDWRSIRRDLLRLFPCCSLQKGSFPFCDPRC